MESENLFCPVCGHHQFTQTRISQSEVCLSYHPLLGWQEERVRVVDEGGLGESSINCEGCGYEIEESELVEEDSALEPAHSL